MFNRKLKLDINSNESIFLWGPRQTGKSTLLHGIFPNATLRYELFALIAEEIGEDFNLDTALNNGYLPRHYLAANSKRMLQAYVIDYLKEEIAEEGLVRNLPAMEFIKKLWGDEII